MMVYANDNDDRYPTADKWNDLLISEVDMDPESFRCKGVKDGPGNYAMNKNVIGRTDVPEDMVLVFETAPGWNQVGGAEVIAECNHGSRGINILFGDGHVEFVSFENIGLLNWGDEQPE